MQRDSGAEGTEVTVDVAVWHPADSQSEVDCKLCLK